MEEDQVENLDQIGGFSNGEENVSFRDIQLLEQRLGIPGQLFEFMGAPSDRAKFEAAKIQVKIHIVGRAKLVLSKAGGGFTSLEQRDIDLIRERLSSSD